MPDRYETIVRPVVTEKSSNQYGLRKEYTFEVHPDASKYQIRDAVETLFDVRVLRVRTMIQPAKRRSMGRSVGRRPAWKKAMVRLHPDDSIDVFEG